jgi:hypothetical protein
MDAAKISGLILALGSTVLISLAYLREHEAVASLPPLSLRQPMQSARLLLRSRDWLFGFLMESSGFILYVVALALAPLALVQTVAAGGVGVLAVATARLGHRPLQRRELIGALLAVSGLALLAASLGGGDARDAPGELGPIMLWLGLTAGAAVLVYTSGRLSLRNGVGAGIAGGLFFAVGDISTKVATEGAGRLVFVVPLVAGYLLGTSLVQIGYQAGGALTVAGLATLFTNAVPIAAGTVVLHEDVPTGALGVLRILAFFAVTVGAILLARPGSRRPSSTPDQSHPSRSPAPLTRASAGSPGALTASRHGRSSP